MTNQASDMVVIPREKAVFWLDSQGWWRNDGGRFGKKKIIDYFHRHMGRDENGYFVLHDKGEIWEKVYFPYEDTALFVFGMRGGDNGKDICLVLNTGREIALEPDKLYIHQDRLYMMHGNERIKFAERAMIKMANMMEEDENGRLVMCAGGRAYTITEN